MSEVGDVSDFEGSRGYLFVTNLFSIETDGDGDRAFEARLAGSPTHIINFFSFLSQANPES